MSAAGGILGGIIGANNSAGASGNANNDANIANQILQQIGQAPDVSAPLILQQYKQAGLVTPEMEQQITAQVPAAIGQDKTAINAQQQALQQMQQRASGGLSAGDRAALNQAGLKTQGDVQGRLGSIAQQMQQQGLSDSGSKLAMQLSAAQGGANTESANADQIAQQAQQAAIQASGQAAGLGSQLENQNFGEGMANQQAANQMQRFNIQNQLGVQQQNTNSANQAQAANLANAQQLSNQNTTAQNQELYNQQQQQMNQYNANKNTSQIQAGGYSGLGQQQQNLANNQAKAGVALGTGIGGLAGQAASSGALGDSAQAAMFSQGGQIPSFKEGGRVPGQEMVPGDHPINDTVHARLSPGEIVIPKTMAKSPIGKKLLKLLEDHHHVQKELDKYGNG